MKKLFGTDGLRGIVGEKLSSDLAMKVGMSLAYILKNKNPKVKKVLIGKDTRISGDMLESALVAGICSVGVNCYLAGIVPTPAMSFLVDKYNFDAGIMISASHNPMNFNGIKIFDNNGLKISDDLELKIENYVLNNRSIKQSSGENIGRMYGHKNAISDYINHLCEAVVSDLSGIKVIVDCANGSASKTVNRLFKKLGIDFKIINGRPNGLNINKYCGSTNMDKLSKLVVEGNYDLGVSFDGDADRCLAVDENGHCLDGDNLLAIFAKDLQKNNKLNGSVVSTVMTNLGFFKFAKDNDINFKVTKVGDRYVLEKMLELNCNLGGEQSGHIIFRACSKTGDGQLTAIKLIECIKNSGMKLSELRNLLKKFPQKLKNIYIDEDRKNMFTHDLQIQKYINMKKKSLGNEGRILVRCSGTEPIIRVMVECEDENIMNKIADEIVNEITYILG